MDPENDCKMKMDEPLKREMIFGKLFEELEKDNKIESSGSLFENLPKLVLCHILMELKAKDVVKFFRVNKYFFKFLWISPNSSKIFFFYFYFKLYFFTNFFNPYF